MEPNVCELLLTPKINRATCQMRLATEEEPKKYNSSINFKLHFERWVSLCYPILRTVVRLRNIFVICSNSKMTQVYMFKCGST